MHIEKEYYQLQKIHSMTKFISIAFPLSTLSKTNSKELFKHFWEMKWKGIEKPIIHWSVIDHAKVYQNRSKRCNLYLTEKYHI